jgi:hypothetical protein
LHDGTCIQTLGNLDGTNTKRSTSVCLDATHEWCVAMGMIVNGSKTRVLQINGDHPVHNVCAGEVALVVAEAQYLRLQLYNRRGLHATIKKLE